MQKPIPAMLAASAQMSASRANKRTWLRVWPDMLREGIFKCPPAEQINAQTHIGRGGQHGNYMTVRELGTATYT